MSSCCPSSFAGGPVLLQHPIGVLKPLEPLRVQGCLKNLGVALAGERRPSAASVLVLDGNHGSPFPKCAGYSGTRVARVSRAHVGFARDAMRHVDFVRDTECHVWVDQQMDLISTSVAGRLRFSW